MTDAVMNAIDLRRKLQQHDRLTAPAYIRQWLEQEFWFENLIQNGGFDSDTIWTKDAEWSIASGVAEKVAPTAGVISQAVSLSGFAYCSIAYDLTRTAASFFAQLTGGTTINGVTRSASGSYSEVLQVLPTHDTFKFYAATNAAGTVDNLALFESDGTDIIHRLPEGYDVSQVFVDGLKLREGAAHDFTKETDGFTNWIKPAVAPGAATQTCIMGVRVK